MKKTTYNRTTIFCLIVLTLLVMNASGLDLLSSDDKFQTIPVDKDTLTIEYECEFKVVETLTLSGFEIQMIPENISTFKSLKGINETTSSYYELSVPRYTTSFNTVCEDESRKAITITSETKAKSKYLDLANKDMTFSIKDNILTTKDLSRGGSWKDRDLDSCWNAGVPCQQYDITNPENINTISEIKDDDKGVESIE